MNDFDRLINYFSTSLDEQAVAEALDSVRRLVQELYSEFLNRQPISLVDFLTFFVLHEDEVPNNRVLLRLAGLTYIHQMASQLQVEEQLFL